MKDFAECLVLLMNTGIVDKVKAQHIAEKFFESQKLLTSDEVSTLKEVKKSLDEQEAKAEELAKGT